MATPLYFKLLPFAMLLRGTFSFFIKPNGWLRHTPLRVQRSRLHVISSNQELVQKRLAVRREKKAARDRSVQEVNERNLNLKRLLHTNNASFVPEMYAIRVSVCENLREELRLSGREKRGRVFIEKGSNATDSIKSLKHEIHGFFRALRKSTYLLSAGYPIVNDNGTISSPDIGDIDSFWELNSDDDVSRTFEAADAMFEEKAQLLKRPSIAIHVRKDPNAPEPPPPPAYLKNLPDPSQTKSMTMLSFYAFPPDGIADPEDFAFKLKKLWKPFSALGRVYVAKEGTNAQMSVPTNVIDQFCACCREIPELKNMENGINIDPVTISTDDFAVAGTPVNGRPAPPFRNLHVRARSQIVADGLSKELDWQSAGYDMPPLEWHQQIQNARELRNEGKENEAPIILDCRNTYETDLGIFEGAEALGTDSFRDSWEVLKGRLAQTPKDAPIMTYCTGGIRCVKVGAYLTQELGFKNVSRLAGGIIAYDRSINEESDMGDGSMFKGTNFVFDGRLGRAITDDALASCITCGAETSSVSNCLNENCHKRIVQCESCRTSYHGTCSDACRNRIVNGGMVPERAVKGYQAGNHGRTFRSLEEYSVGHSSPAPPVLGEVELSTRVLIPSGSHMVSGESQGRLLSQLASMTREGRILELGTFTGYATACLLEGAANVADISGRKGGDRNSGPFVMSMERDARAYDVAVAHLDAICAEPDDAGKVAALYSAGNIKSLPNTAEKLVSLRYGSHEVGCELVHVTDALASVEEMAAGSGDLQGAPFDLVFVDADKTRLLEYAEACLSSDRLLKRGGLLVVDNVLWKGLVLDAANGDDSPILDGETESNAEARKSRRARKLASKMHFFNSQVIKDDRAEVIILPMRDGLSIIRKK